MYKWNLKFDSLLILRLYLNLLYKYYFYYSYHVDNNVMLIIFGHSNELYFLSWKIVTYCRYFKYESVYCDWTSHHCCFSVSFNNKHFISSLHNVEFAQSKMCGGEETFWGRNGMGMRNDCLCTSAKAGSSSRECLRKKTPNHKSSADQAAKIERDCT